jgi:arginyl-tRNA synthetase
MDYKKTVSEALSKQLLPLGFAPDKIIALLEKPPQPELGDLSFPCFAVARELKKSPVEIASELSQKMGAIEGIAKVQPTGPYLNFFVDTAAQSKAVIADILSEKTKFGARKRLQSHRVMVEYSGPNTNKPLHIGHLRNNTLGMCLSNVLALEGFKVIRANIVNDRGTHICKSMLAYQLFGNGVTPKSVSKKSDHFVGDYYVRFAQEAEKDPSLNDRLPLMLKKWEESDKTVRALWKKMNGWAIDGFKETYERFGTEFDVWFYESEVYDKAKPILDAGIKRGVFQKRDDGALVAKLDKFGLPDKVVLRSDGTSIYVTQDLALTAQKFAKHKLDSALWVVASEQNLYFEQLFKILELLGYAWAKDCHHVSYGLVHLPVGRMKSREGTVVDADDLLDDVTALARAEIETRYPALAEKEKALRSNAIALAAIKFYMLKFDAKKDMTFNPKESLSFEGETGPYLLYAYARAKSILAKGKAQKADYALLSTPAEKQLVGLLSEYPQKLSETRAAYSPHILCHYLLSVAAAFNSFYHEQPVLNAEPAVRNARLGLVSAVSIVLRNGLAALGIETLEKM